MKLLMTALCSLIAFSASAADYMPVEATYVVPSPDPSNPLPFSTMKVLVNTPYQGTTSTALSYTFPEELTGSPALTINLTRVPGTANEWTGPQMTASCSEVGNIFKCNMFIVKPVVKRTSIFIPMAMAAPSPLVDKILVQDFLLNQGKSILEVEQRLNVIDQFLSSEPAGELSYIFK